MGVPPTKLLLRLTEQLIVQQIVSVETKLASNLKAPSVLCRYNTYYVLYTTCLMVRSFNIRVRVYCSCWVDVGAGDVEVDVIYVPVIMSVQYIGYLVPYKDKVQRQLDNRVEY